MKRRGLARLAARAALAIAVLQSPASAHDAYGAWVQNGNGVSCCHDQDCRPTSFCALPDGGEGIALLIAGYEP